MICRSKQEKFFGSVVFLVLIFRVFDDEGNWFEGENQQGKRGCFPGLLLSLCVFIFSGTFVRKMNIGGGGPGLKVGGMPTDS